MVKALFTLSEKVRGIFFPLHEYFLTEIQCFIQFMLNKIQWLESEVEWDQIGNAEGE